MKPRVPLLIATFTGFYFFTDLNWEIGNYLAGHSIYSFLRTRRGLLAEISGYLPFLSNSIISYFLFLWGYHRKQWKAGTIAGYIVFAVPVMIMIRYLIQEALFYRLFGYHNYSEAMRAPARYFMDNIYFAIYYSALGIIFFFIQLNNYNQRRQQELLLQHRQAELAFLRSQINPHFLFNSLNNVYTLVYQASQKALPAIGKLSELMRYMLYEKAEQVALQKELDYLRSYIDLQLLRYDFEPSIRIDLQVLPGGNLQVAPLTLIPFVENAFKHGALNDPQQPLLIELKAIAGHLHFSVVNKISHYQKDQNGGIGLDNVRKRLALIYGKDHSLAIDQENGLFKVYLSIRLHE